MKFFLLLFSIAFLPVYNMAIAQDGPIEVTPVLEKKMSAQIEQEATRIKTEMTKKEETASSIEFALDTFRIEKYQKLYMSYDWSTSGMRMATYQAAHQYDSLLNKYYKRLSATLKGADKQTLVQAQKSWISFRDNETKLVGTISKDEYSGGGTIQQLIDASEYLGLIKDRTITIYRHLLRATQDY